MFISTETRVNVATHQAKAFLRTSEERHRQRFAEVVDQAEYPSVVLGKVVRNLGRHNALAMEIPEQFVNATLRR